MVKLSELQMKEIIVIEDGRRLGHIQDLEIDEKSGHIISLVIPERDKKGGFFGKTLETFVKWNQIATIGADVILVRETEQKLLGTKTDSKNDTI